MEALKLKQARLEKGLSIRSFARKYGISPATVSRWEATGRVSDQVIHKMILSLELSEQYNLFSYLKTKEHSPECIKAFEELLTLIEEKMNNTGNHMKEAA